MMRSRHTVASATTSERTVTPRPGPVGTTRQPSRVEFERLGDVFAPVPVGRRQIRGPHEAGERGDSQRRSTPDARLEQAADLRCEPGVDAPIVRCSRRGHPTETRRLHRHSVRGLHRDGGVERIE